MPRKSLWVWAGVVGGYLSMGRAFAYLGVSPLFVGEAYLGAAVLRNRHNWTTRFIEDCLHLRPLPIAILFTLLWGLFEVFRSLLINRPAVEALRLFAFNYYPLYVLIGVAIGRDMTMERFLHYWKKIAIGYAIYVPIHEALAFALWNKYDVPLQPLPPLVPLATIALLPHLRDWKPRYWITMVNLYPVFFFPGHGRANMLASLAGAIMLAIGYRINWIKAGLAMVTLAVLLLVFGPLIPSPSGASPPLDPTIQYARLLAIVNEDAAIKLMEKRGYQQEVEDIISARGTAEWRRAIWRNAIRSLNRTSLQVMGQGAGASLQDLTPDNQEIHTPHNFMIFCIYYEGYAGLAVFCVFLFFLLGEISLVADPALRNMLRTIYWSTLVIAIMGNCFEGPMGAIPFYLLCGVCIGVNYAALAARRKQQMESLVVDPYWSGRRVAVAGR